MFPSNWTVRWTTRLQGSVDRKWEGIVAKRADSQYVPGRRSRTWFKMKNFRTREVVVVGWRPGAGRRAGSLGSLLVAVPDDDGGLRYAGKVGTGFTDAVLDQLMAALQPTAAKDLGSGRQRAAGGQRRTRSGSNRPWSVRSDSRTGRANAGCAPRVGAGLRPDKAVADINAAE